MVSAKIVFRIDWKYEVLFKIATPANLQAVGQNK